MTAPRRFWMVCRWPTHPGSRTEPRMRYPSQAEARAAARDLAIAADAPFCILEMVEVVAADTTPSLFD